MGMMDLIRGKKEDGSAGDGFAERKALSEFQNPFLKGKVAAVHIHIINMEAQWGSLQAGRIMMTASVEFKNGNTSGEQKLSADTFADLVEKINAFIKSME